MRTRLAVAASLVSGFLLGVSLLGIVVATEPAPEPVVVVCTWGHGCQETTDG